MDINLNVSSKNKKFRFALKASPHYGPTQVRSILAPYFIYHNNLKDLI
jgi:hypothetical protein